MEKDITFFIKDSADRHLYDSIITEAQKRGYTTKVTDNPHEQGEIGFYCQHVNYPENSKFSVIMLHDLIQAYPRWPDIWEVETWDKYDIGMLPSKFWVDMWKNASYKPWTMPRFGVYEVGWPKADITVREDFRDTVNKLSDELSLDITKKTVLYAPSWENDNKQDDFVQAMLQLDVNILIKQAHIEREWGAEWDVYYEMYDAIQAMNVLHKNIPNVHILDSKTNILHVIALADVLVSEESSTMCEMVLMGKPVVAVEDWLIPDTIPRRTACKGHAFTIKATKATLKDTMIDVIRRYDFYQQQAVEFRDNNFLPVGDNAKKIMDIIDAAVNGKDIPYDKAISVPLSKIDLRYYTGTDNYSDGDVEKRILHYICNNEPEAYSDIFLEDSEWAVFYHLTQFRKNLLNWYSFKPEASLLEIGAGMGGLTPLFCEKCEHVTAVEMSKRRATAIQARCRNYDNLDIVVGDFTKMQFERKYDYITVIGVLEYQSVFGSGDTPQLDFINALKRFLAPGGKLIVAIENKFGLKYWTGEGDDHSGIPFGSINDFAYGGAARTFDKQELSALLAEAGFGKQKFYYPLPDYKLPRLIFTDEYISTDSYSEARPLYYYRNRHGEMPIVVDENKIREPIVRNGVFPFFANSFLVECAIDDNSFDDTVFASIQGGRIEKYRIITRFNGKNFFKSAVSPKAVSHIQQSYNNVVDIQNRGIPVVEHQFDQGIISTPAVNSETAEQRFVDMLKKHDIIGAKKLLDKLYAYILQSSEKAEPKNNFILEAGLLSEGEAFDFGVILKSAHCDMTLFNCFCKGDDFLFFDQEWRFPNLPAGYVMFRAILITYTHNQFLEELCPIQYWKTMYNIEALWPVYLILEDKLMRHVFNTDLSVIASLSYIPPEMIRDNISLLRIGHEQLRQMQEQINQMQAQIQSAALFVDFGNGFSEDLSIKVFADIPSDGKFVFEFDLHDLFQKANSKIVALRFDPDEGSFLQCNIESIEMNGSILNAYPLNSIKNRDEYDTFLTIDPIYILHGDFNGDKVVITGTIRLLDNQTVAEEISSIREENQGLEASLTKITNSFFWKITKPLRITLDSAKRIARYIKSKTKKATDTFGKVMRYLKHYGFRAAVKKIESKVFRRKKIKSFTLVQNDIFTGCPDTLETGKSVSFIIPTKNGGDEYELLLKNLKNQRGFTDIEIIIVDSGSTDNTVEISRRYGAKVIQIQPEEFTHSYSRNLGAENATKEYLCVMTQDALPSTEYWLYYLYQTMNNNPDIAAISCAEYSRADSDLYHRAFAWNHYKYLGALNSDIIMSMPDSNDPNLIRQNGQLSDITCFIKRDTMLKYRYRGSFAEDLDLGMRLISDGHKLALLGNEAAIHSHNRGSFYYLKRRFVELVTLKSIFPDLQILDYRYNQVLKETIFLYYYVTKLLENWRGKNILYPFTVFREEFLIQYRGIRKNCFPSVKMLDHLEGFGMVDDQTEKFLNSIIKQFKNITTHIDERYNGVIIDAMEGYLNVVFSFMAECYEVVDNEIVDEYAECVYKIWASVAGTFFAYSYLSNEDDRNKHIDFYNAIGEGV